MQQDHSLTNVLLKNLLDFQSKNFQEHLQILYVWVLNYLFIYFG